MVPLIGRRGLQHELHLFVETASCPPQAIFDVVQKVVSQISPVAVVLGSNNKVSWKESSKSRGIHVSVCSIMLHLFCLTLTCRSHAVSEMSNSIVQNESCCLLALLCKFDWK